MTSKFIVYGTFKDRNLRYIPAHNFSDNNIFINSTIFNLIPQGVEQELLECQALVEDADRLAAAVSTVSGVSDMVAEYRALFADVRTRLDLARAEVVGDVDSAVQVRYCVINIGLQDQILSMV